MSVEGISEKDLRKLRAIMARAEESPYEGERENAWRAATSLMAKLSVGREVLDEIHDSEYTSKPEMFECEIGNPYSQEKIDLLSSIARVFSCRVVYIKKGRQGRATDAFVYGFQRDLDIVWTLYVSISSQMMSEMHNQPSSSISFRRSFIMYFINEAVTRMEQFYAQAVEEVSGKEGAIVLLDRASEVDKFVDQEFPDVEEAKQRKISLDVMGAMAGRDAGQSADVTLADRKVGDDEDLQLSQ